jgi:hypothetical protein
MNANSMSDCELDVVPVKHRRKPLFEVVAIASDGSLAEHGAAVRGAHRELGLEEVALVLRASLLLGVHQKKRDEELRVSVSNAALKVDIRELGIGHPWRNRAIA